IFPELRPYLEQLWDSLPEGAPDQVITRYRHAYELRCGLQRWCLAAGVKPWPRLYHNLRVSRATELADRFPSHVCAAWLGHTEQVADRCYRQVTDEHFVRATREWTDVKSDAQATQNPTLQGAARSDDELSKVTQEVGGREDTRGSAYNSSDFEEPPLSQSDPFA
ncbi:MAG: hypothetical protein NZU63_14775, partial [Gemmataceae bacterium]|nr:hypothetical protein [Gemmataceae bacterium]